ncbi:MAG: AlkA N-terminal domain-containing protein [Thermoleophilia bacterium]
MTNLPADDCYAAVVRRDARFDGWFVAAVTSTRIYCRPSCPAITPRREHLQFHPTAAAAQRNGFRACKRCRPDVTPGSPEWAGRHDVVGRAMRLIADGVVERVGVTGLAGQLGYTPRHLNRVLTDAVGAGPLALARAHRATTARTLIETTNLPFVEIAFAAGFGSTRQFNDTIRAVFASSPTDLRTARRARPGERSDGDRLTMRLPARAPGDVAETRQFLQWRALGGAETADSGEYTRTLRLAHGHGWVAVRPEPAGGAGVVATFALEDWRDLSTAVQRVRRLFDLDADPLAIAERLADDPVLAPLVARHPGRRAPGSVDPFETAVRTVIGQQVSVAGARTVASRLVASAGEALRLPHSVLTHVFPNPEAVADAPDAALAMPAARRDTVRRLAAAVASGDLPLDAGAAPEAVRERLLSLRGVGPWTADAIVMRGLGHPDVLLTDDLGVRRAAQALGLDLRDRARVARWAPWRSYAVHHLWASLDDAPSTLTHQKESIDAA